MYPIPWIIKSGELVLMTPNGILDPVSGQVLYPPFGRILDVFADNRWGNVLVITEEDNNIRIYRSSKDHLLQPVNLLYSGIQSNYLPVVKISIGK